MSSNKFYLKQLYFRWNWIFMILFLLLNILDFRFGIIALMCIIPAIFMAIRNGNKKFCAVSCPRGNFLSQILKYWQKSIKTPKIFRNRIFKNIVFVIMFSLFIKSLVGTDGSIAAIGHVFFRFIFTSTVLGMILGILFKPRTWCQICPLGQGSHLAGKLSLELQNLFNQSG